MAGTQESKTDTPRPEIPYGVHRQGIGDAMRKICGTIAVDLAQYPECKVYMPGSAADQIPLLPVFIPNDFKNTEASLPWAFLRRKHAQETLKKEVPSLLESLSVNLGSAALRLTKSNHWIIELQLADEGNERVTTERQNVCKTLAEMAGFKDFNTDELNSRQLAIEILRTPKDSVPKKVLEDLEETTNIELSDKAGFAQARLPKLRSKPRNNRKNSQHRKPKPQTKQDLEEMLESANLRPVRQPNPGSRRRRRR